MRNKEPEQPPKEYIYDYLTLLTVFHLLFHSFLLNFATKTKTKNMKKFTTILLAAITMIACTQTKKNETESEHLQSPVKTSLSFHEIYDAGDYMAAIVKNAPEGTFRTAFANSPMAGFVAVADTAQFMEAMRTDSMRAALPEDCCVMLSRFREDIPEEEGELYPVYLVKTSKSLSLWNPTFNDIYVTNETFAGHPVISIQLSDSDTKQWATMTRTNIGKFIALVLDGHTLSVPRVLMEIENGAASISSAYTEEEAHAIVNEIIGRTSAE